MLVRELMTSPVITCSVDDSLQSAVERMLEAQIGSIIVTQNDEPYGIMTETDVLLIGAETGRPLSEIPVKAASSHPLTTITGDVPIRSAVKQMMDHSIKKLPVVDGLDLIGIITQTDIVGHYSEFIKEAHASDALRRRWDASRFDIDKF